MQLRRPSAAAALCSQDWRDLDRLNSLEEPMNGSALNGMAVVSIGDGAKVGNIHDVLVDTSNLRVVAVILMTGSGRSTLPFAAIRGIGPDVVTVESAKDLGAPAPPAPESHRNLTDLTRMSVVNSDGAMLGQVRDMEIDQTDGRIAQLNVHRGGVLGIGGSSLTVAPAQIRSMGPQFVTVDVPAAEDAPSPGTERPPA
jgi:sporulation protein YlmC with PRC-barrel domain